jgi:hypothetical protein
MAKRLLIASSRGTRWRWALYCINSAGCGLRLHRVRNAELRRWNVFFDIPLLGGLSLYVQDK